MSANKSAESRLKVQKEVRKLKYEDGGLSDRKKLILKAIVEAHIQLCEPVGSKYLTQNQQISYSSATIRNEMAELEALGYLEQPHTSAGRIPSEAGYRFYVDSLVEQYSMTAAEVERIKKLLRQKQSELDGILDCAMRLASSMTNYTALALKPQKSTASVRRFEVIPVNEYNLLLVMVNSDGTANTQNIRSQVPVTENVAHQLSLLLNEKLCGLRVEEITLPLLMQMEERMGIYDYLIQAAAKAVSKGLAATESGELHLDGVNRLLSYPEYYDFDRLRDMLELFEKKDELLSLISKDAHEAAAENKKNSVRVYIGSENVVRIMDNSTLIFKPIQSGGTTVGAIGIIGPTRMNYSKVISMIDHLTEGVSEIIADDTDSDDAPPGTFPDGGTAT